MADTTRTVSRFEANLLTILRFLLGQPGRGDAVRTIGEKWPRPVCLSTNGIHLIKDSLAKGCVLFLVKRGGWRVERILKRGEVANGRVWDRTTLSERMLNFGPEIVEDLNHALLERAVADKLLRGRRLRVDTTCIEADVRYPTDSGLSAHAVSRLGRAAARREYPPGV